MVRILRLFSLILATFSVVFLVPSVSNAAMNSTTYQIQWDSIGPGGTDASSSSSFKLRDSISNGLDGIGSSSSFRLDSGYRAGIYDPTVFFDLFSQDLTTQAGATSLSSNTVGVTTTSGYSVGDFVAIIQDEGASQVSAIGKVVTVGGSSLTVDFLSTGVLTPTIDGANDFVYELAGTSLPLSSLSSTTMSTGIVGWDVTADVPSGYGMYVLEDGDLRAGGGSPIIDDVADGAVTIGSSEYGAESSDTTLASSTFDSQDTAFTSQLPAVGSRSADSFKSRDFLTLKAAVDATAADATYSQTLTFVFVGNY